MVLPMQSRICSQPFLLRFQMHFHTKRLLWLDDMLMNSSTVDEHLEYLGLLFEFCALVNLKLHPEKF